jgi:hypothetical protein
MANKLNVFISYAHEDEQIKKDLDNHLTTLKHSDKINVWHDRRLKGGDEWDKSIKEEIQKADIILLLISPDFISSSYIYRIELEIAMQKHENGEAQVIPIYVSSVDTKYEPYRKLNPLPKDAKPIDLSENKNKTLADIAVSLREIVEEKITQLERKDITFSNQPKDNYTNVFLSVAAPHTDVQLRYIQQLKELFKSHKINLLTLNNNDWNDNDPIKPIYSLMQQCKGCVVLLIERYYIENGKVKRGAHNESVIVDKALTTPWCQIETTLAYTLRLPQLIIKDKNVMNDGVFMDHIKKFKQVNIDIDNFDEWKSSDKDYILNDFIDKVKS